MSSHGNGQTSLQPVPLRAKIAYAIGQFGWSLGGYGVINLLNYFYFPPEGSRSGTLPAFVTQEMFWGFTVLGIIAFAGRIFDAVSDPVIAGFSDHSLPPFGRRINFLALGGAPMAAFAFMAFFPPVLGESFINVIWLSAAVFGFFFAMTLYCAPFFALLSELGHNSAQRLTLATMASVAWALGFATGNMIYALKPVVEPIMVTWGVAPELVTLRSFQTILAGFSLLAAVAMYVPFFVIDERKYCRPHTSTESILQSVISTLKNRNFRWFAACDLLYWISLTILQSCIGFYVTLLLNAKEELTTALLTTIFGVSFLFYVPVHFMARKLGKRITMIIGFAVFVLTYAMVMISGDWLPLGGEAQGYIIAIVTALPMAIFGILPVATVADIAEADGLQTGNYKEGMFMATHTLAMKFGMSIAALIIPTLLSFGKSVENSSGVRLTALVSLVFCAMGCYALWRYSETEIDKTLTAEQEDT